MQFSTLNAYPSAVPVPKEIFADVLHAVPLGSFDHHTRGKQVLPGFFKLLQHPPASSLECTLDAGRVLHAARRDVALVRCAASGAGGAWLS